MFPATLSKQTHFSVFRSASDEAEAKVDQEIWDNEGGHMSSAAGVVVSTPGCDMPYKAVLTHDADDRIGHVFATMREAEAFIWRNAPRPAARCTLFDRVADEGLGSKPPSKLFP